MLHMIKHATEKFNSRPYLNSNLRINSALIPMKELLCTRPTSFPGSRSFEPAPEPELGQSSCKNKNKQMP